MSATAERIESADPILRPPTDPENVAEWRSYLNEANRRNYAVWVPPKVSAVLREELDAAIAKGIPSLPTTSSSQTKSQGQDLQPSQIKKDPKKNNETEKDPAESKETEKAQETKLETFLKINKDLLSTAGSPIERLFLHAASIAVFAISLGRSRVKSAKENSGLTKTDGNRENGQNFRAKTQTQAVNIKVNVEVHQPPLEELRQKGADFVATLTQGRAQTGRTI